jgi:hypothetical protein
MTSKNFKQSMVNQDQEIIFEVVKVSGSWVFPAASSIVEATRGKNMYLRLTDDGKSDIFRLDSVKDGENAGETVFGFVGNGGMDLVELTATTDGAGVTTGSWEYAPGEGPAGEAIGNLGDGGVKYVSTSDSYSDVAAAISRGQLPIMTIVSGGTVYYYFPFYNGSGRIEFRSIQDNGINCFTWNGTAWVAGDSVIYGMGSDTKSEADIDQGVLAIDGGNVVTKVTLATVNAVTFSVNESVPAFAIEIDNTGNSNDVDITVVDGATTLKYSSAAVNQVGAGKYVQLTCVGGC